MAKKDLRAQMDAARAAAAFIDAAHDELESSREMRGEGADEAAGADDGERSEAASRNRAAKSTVEAFGAPSATTASSAVTAQSAATAPSAAGEPSKPKASRTRKPRKKNVEAAPVEEAVEGSGARMTAQVLVPMTAEQREHADLLASVMKVTRAEVMRQALDEYWESHKSELQAAVAAYEELIKKLMK